MKKTIKCLSACTILITSIGFTFTDVSAISGVSNVDKDYENRIKYYEKLEKERDKKIAIEEKKEAELLKKTKNKMKISQDKKEFYSIPVTYTKQAYSNFCGVASGIQALSFHKKKSNSKDKLPTQKHFGVTIGVLANKGGTSSTKLRNGLNQYKHVYKFSKTPYIVGNISQFKNPAKQFESRVKSSLKNKTTAPIILVDTESMHKRYTKNYRHYVTVTAYDSSKKMVKLMDPNHIASFSSSKGYWAKITVSNISTAKNESYKINKANKSKKHKQKRIPNKYKSITTALLTSEKTSPNPVMVW